VAFSGDGTTLASADGEWDRPGAVRLWDVEEWKQRAVLPHTGEVLGLAFAPKAAVLAAASWDGTVKVWDFRKGPPPDQLPAPRELKK
jgi:WD40 repeat protein